MMDRAELISGLKEENERWLALLDQIDPARMDQPGVTGPWSVKDIVAHLTGWRRRTVARLQAECRGEPEPPAPWPAHLKSEDEINAWFYEANKGRSVGEVLDDSEQVFEALLAAIECLPEDILRDPQGHLAWLEGQPFSASEFFAHFHEEHEPDIRAWLARVEKE
jgi:hypothetical protein